MVRWANKTLSGWGRVHRAASTIARPERIADLASIWNDAHGSSLLAQGALRSYGDAALNSHGRSIDMRRIDRLLELDTTAGTVVAEAGVTFSDLVAVLLPHGYMPPVVPGTGFATLGGGVANDVHGKNHHRNGSFGQHLGWLDLRLPSGDTRRVEPVRDAALFQATVGGLGLTGVIERLCLKLQRVPSNAVMVRKRRISDIDRFLQGFADEQDNSEYVVGWIDALARGGSLGRGILESASPAPVDIEAKPARSRRIPIDFPGSALNPLSVRMFNACYFRHVPTAGVSKISDYPTFLFPLDALHDWNRIYGKRGFHQFQCVVPFEGGRESLVKMLDVIGKSASGSFLAVLKAMGRAGSGFLSFPRPGYTLALDFPNTAGCLATIRHLEKIACEHGGRTYLAKDSTLEPGTFRRMYPDLDKFEAVLSEVDPLGLMQSDMTRRLEINRKRK